jgi:hypothetical protein
MGMYLASFPGRTFVGKVVRIATKGVRGAGVGLGLRPFLYGVSQCGGWGRQIGCGRARELGGTPRGREKEEEQEPAMGAAVSERQKTKDEIVAPPAIGRHCAFGRTMGVPNMRQTVVGKGVGECG